MKRTIIIVACTVAVILLAVLYLTSADVVSPFDYAIR